MNAWTARAVAAGDRRHRAAQRVSQPVAGRVDRHLAAAQETVQRVARDEPAVEERRQRLAQPRLAELGEQQRNVGIVGRDGPADGERAVQRRFDKARRFGFVGEIESGIDAGLEREFVQQREAEGVDGADADVVERIADLAPPRRAEAALAMPLAERRHDALAHFRRRLARKGDRQDVARRDAGFEQAHVTIDEHAGLAGARRRLESDVAERIDRQPPRPRVGRLVQRLDAAGVEVEARLISSSAASSVCPGPPGCRQTATNAHIVQRFRVSGRAG